MELHSDYPLQKPILNEKLTVRDLPFWISNGDYFGLNQLGKVLERVRHELTDEEARIEAFYDDAADNQKQPPQTERLNTVPRASNDNTLRARDDLNIQSPDNSARHATDDPTIQAPDNLVRDDPDVPTIQALDNPARRHTDDIAIQAPDNPTQNNPDHVTFQTLDEPARQIILQIILPSMYQITPPSTFPMILQNLFLMP